MSKSKENIKEIMLHFETVAMAYKKGVTHAAFICSLIFPEICSKHDGFKGATSKKYEEWWEINFSPFLTIPINKDKDIQYHISGVVGNKIRCATFHEAKFSDKQVVKEFKKFYDKNIDTNKNISVFFMPDASHHAFIMNETKTEINIELWLNQEYFVHRVLMYIEKKYLWKGYFDTIQI